MAILLTGQQSDNFESLNSLKLSLTNIWGLCSKNVSFDPFLKPNSPDILALCGANVDDSIGSGNFSFKGYLPLIWKDSFTHMHVLAVYVRKGLPLVQNVSLENSEDSYLCFWLGFKLHFCCFGFHWFSFKLKRGYPISLHILSLRSFETFHGRIFFKLSVAATEFCE